MRLSEMTDEQLIREVADDALAREIFNRLVLSRLRVSDEVQALEHQRDKAQADYEKAMARVSDYEVEVTRLRNQKAIAEGLQKRMLLACPPEGLAIHRDTMTCDISDVEIRMSSEERFGVDGWFVVFKAVES